MEILAYGEDALTLWALKHKLPHMLELLHDSSTIADCQVFFRPSFGRSGGPTSSQFGEFDFIVLAKDCIYLGESKWDRSSEKMQDGLLTLRSEQLLRHEIFQFYVEEWAFGQYQTWQAFEVAARPKLQLRGINKPIAPAGSLLAANLQTVLRVIRSHYSRAPQVKNLLLYLHVGVLTQRLPHTAGKDFEVIVVDYAACTFDHFIKLDV